MSVVQKKNQKEAPEGGWGYVIMLSLVVVNLASFGYLPSMGIMYADFLANLGLQTKALTMLPSYFFVCFCPVGLFTNYLYNLFSLRSVAIFGAMLVCCGSMMVIFVRSLNELLLAYSLIQGVGFGLMIPAMYTTFNRYFIRRRITMIGIVSSMTGLVSVGIPTFIEMLMKWYGFRGSMAILAALNFHVLLGMIALLPLDWWRQKKVSTKRSPLLPEDESDVHLENCKPIAPETSVWTKIVEFLDLTLLLQPVYVNICLGMSIVFFADLTFFTILPTYLRELSFDKMDIAYILSIVASADLSSRLFVTIVSSLTTKIKARHLFLAGLIAMVWSLSALHYVNSFAGMSVVISCLGFFRAWMYVPLNIIFAEYLPPERFISGQGLFSFIQGLVLFVIGPAIGWVRDYTQSFAITFMLLTLAMLLCAVSWMIEMFIVYLRSAQRKRRISIGQIEINDQQLSTSQL